jgi:RNA polymerase sigma-70 factor, ECF subfamily
MSLKNGEPEAYKALFRQLYPRLKGYCKLFVHSDSMVEDIIQECFLTLWEKRSGINPDKSVESFLFVILRNRCLNYLKENKLKEDKINPDDLHVTELQYLYQLDLTEKEEKSLEEQLIVSFNQAVDSLPDKMKTVFVKCKIEGQKQKIVADELGISIKTIEKHIVSAKKQISERLTREYPLLAILIALWLN